MKIIILVFASLALVQGQEDAPRCSNDLGLSISVRHYIAKEDPNDGMQYFQVWLRPKKEMLNVVVSANLSNVQGGGLDFGRQVEKKVNEPFAFFEKTFRFPNSSLRLYRIRAYVQADGIPRCMVEGTLAQ
jgi:hypothetical protein